VQCPQVHREEQVEHTLQGRTPFKAEHSDIKSGVTWKELSKWWKEHKLDDAKNEAYRLKEQKPRALRKKALAKLTPEEKKLLRLLEQ
jgi:hypothetical protein